MTYHFTKMHGLGNDFMVIDATHSPISFTPDQIKAWSQRHTGIGFDQCLVVEKSTEPDVDFFYRIYNADGHEVGQCGNGARCLARFVTARGLTHKNQLCVQTRTTRMQLQLHPDHSVSVQFDCPQLEPSAIPIDCAKKSPWYTLSVNEQRYTFHAIQVGNPHAVLVVKDVVNAPVETIGSTLSMHAFFPEQANIGFMQILSPHHIRLRVFERGCGETQACGSGAVAAMALGRLFHQLAENVTVSLPGGDLTVTWPDGTHPITLRGPATFVYEGHLLESNACASSS